METSGEAAEASEEVRQDQECRDAEEHETRRQARGRGTLGPEGTKMKRWRWSHWH